MVSVEEQGAVLTFAEYDELGVSECEELGIAEYDDVVVAHS